jgi:hypothetical protein
MTPPVNTPTNSAVEVQEQYVHTSKKVAKRLAAAQERNVKYTQSIFESTIALLKSHVEDTHFLMEQWGRQGDAQASEPYMNLFRAPFTAYQQMLEGMETASRQMLEGMESATRGSFESFEKATESLEEGNHAKMGAARK